MSFSSVLSLTLTLTFCATTMGQSTSWQSLPPQRPLPTASTRALENGPALYVDPNKGDDANDGSKAKPWRTINHAFKTILAGDTLVLRGGTYYENVYCAIEGTKEKPITVRSAPGELAIISGGIPVFEQDPTNAWEPVKDGPKDEYVSTAVYKNIRDVVGRFGDSMVGLQTYWYRMDLQATNELWINNKTTMVDPIYCGPGLWYNKLTGRIHVRLAHTKLQLPESETYKYIQYEGETDPRKLPLIVASYASEPLKIDQASHVRFQDIVLRGGGYRTLRLTFGVDVSFDHCTIYAGTYGVWAKNTGPLTMTNCGVYGMIAPWMFRTENVSYAYSAKVYPPFVGAGEESSQERLGSTKVVPKVITRHISRLPTHALVATEGGYEFETFYYPLNHDWDISNCEFTDGHDGVYLSGRDIYFHHNLVDNMQDDAVYVSGPTPGINDGIYIYQNLLRTFVTGFAGHPRGGPSGKIHIYRNILDERQRVRFGRPSTERPGGFLYQGAGAWQVHNADHILHMEDIYFYQNTCIVPMNHIVSAFSSSMVFSMSPESQRRAFNNIYMFISPNAPYPTPLGKLARMADYNLIFDGNLTWSINPDAKVPGPGYWKKLSETKLNQNIQKVYPDGLDAHSVYANPDFFKFSADINAVNDYQINPGSAAVNSGMVIPEQWPDPLRKADAGQPDIGALPLGAGPLNVGILGRVTAGQPDPETAR